MEEAALGVVRFDELPSPEDFSSQIESRNVPAVFHGCIKDWKAFSNWNPSNGGLDYLQELVGSSVVEAMLSRNAPVFYGDIRSHEMVPLSFSTFITSCKHLQKSDDGHGVSIDSEGLRLAEPTGDDASFASAGSSHQVYLAQVPISNVEDNERSQLETLREDIQMPKILETKTLASINLWMNSAKSRSSTHYDPHHNLLCVVAGCKQVVLWPPSASPSLYPMPIYGEASNHSSVDLENPDFSTHSRAKNSMEYSQNVILQAGDALFIPEGWYHQVDSDDLTIAVNFWWQSCIMSSISQHMDAYYIRRITRRLVDVEMVMIRVIQKSHWIEVTRPISVFDLFWMYLYYESKHCEACLVFKIGQDQMLRRTSADNGKSGENKLGKLAIGESGHLKHDMDEQRKDEDLEVTRDKHRIMLKQLDPLSLQSLLELVSLVHDGVSTVGQSEQMQSTLADPTTLNLKGECQKIAKASSFNLEDDPVAKTLWTLEPLKLQNVLLAMVHNFPRTVEALILHMLSPLAAEVLTRKFEEMDQRTRKEDRNEFYLVFYGVFDDQSAAMDAILNGKEAFARQAFQNVLDKYLGVNVDG